MILEQQISFLELFLKDNVTLNLFKVFKLSFEHDLLNTTKKNITLPQTFEW